MTEDYGLTFAQISVPFLVAMLFMDLSLSDGVGTAA
jgi:hypothetical protein